MDIQEQKRQKKIQSQIKYAKKSLKRVPLDLQIETYEKWKKAAENMGIGLNTLIKSAVNEKIENLEKSLALPVDSHDDESGKALSNSLSD